MNFPTTAMLPFGHALARQPLELEFFQATNEHRQVRFQGRTVLRPIIQMSDYRFKAVIDWIEFRATFIKTTNFMSVQRIISKFLNRKSFVLPVSPGRGNESCVFSIRIQEPKSVSLLTDIYGALIDELGEAAAPLICAIEISLDAYPRKPSDHARAIMFGVMQRTIFTTRDIWTKAGSRPRSSVGVKTAGPVDLHNRKLLTEVRNQSHGAEYLLPENHSSPWLDGTMYFGARNDDVMLKIMHKTIDEQNRHLGTFKRLTESQKRVRTEVTIRGAELQEIGLKKLSDLKNMQYGKLQGRYFQFMLPTFCTTPKNSTPFSTLVMMETERRRSKIFLKSGALGLHARDAAQAKYRLKLLPQIRKFVHDRGGSFVEHRVSAGSRGTFMAYAELNRCIAVAFRHLSEAEARAWKRRV